jgi:beta-phosphoglucomutase-like phosphatase (HAD superfamily)
MLKNVIFDWSGVVKDAAENQFWAINKILERLGLKKISFQEMQDNWEQPYMRFYNKYAPELKLEVEKKIYDAVIKEGGYPASDSYPGIVDLIKELKSNGKSMVVLSSDSPNTLLPELKRFGLEGAFAQIFTNVYDKAKKIDKIIGKNNFKTNETIFI